MTLSPGMKGQLTKAIKLTAHDKTLNDFSQQLFIGVRNVFAKHMPREQAKHATRKYLAQLAS